LDLVEGSITSKTEKESSNRGGAGNVEAPPSPERVNVRRMNVRYNCNTTESSGTLAETAQDDLILEREAEVVPRRRTPERKKKKKGCTVRLFRVNNL
jgi:hypothetical protein